MAGFKVHTQKWIAFLYIGNSQPAGNRNRANKCLFHTSVQSHSILRNTFNNNKFSSKVYETFRRDRALGRGGVCGAADSVMLDSHHIRESPPPWRQRAPWVLSGPSGGGLAAQMSACLLIPAPYPSGSCFSLQWQGCARGSWHDAGTQTGGPVVVPGLWIQPTCPPRPLPHLPSSDAWQPM